nr:phosphoribosylaminoimidazolecarboxamide formyltransferase [Paenibacillus whitsoniae]
MKDGSGDKSLFFHGDSPKKGRTSMKHFHLRYGCNPHQAPSRIYSKQQELPIHILNGNPGYINLLDALNAWQLVKELRELFQIPSAASFKHVSPAGAAIGIPLSKELQQAYFVENLELTPLAAAYARARGADRMSSFGDWIALSDKVDIVTAKLIASEVSDGVIAPEFEPEALELLCKKRKGQYTIIQIDAHYVPDELECKDVFGITFEQKRNMYNINGSLLANLVTENKNIPDDARKDLLLALAVTKYTQSNSVVLAKEGQAIGIGAGQQSRIHCTRLAANKADIWYLRQHPKVFHLRFKDGLSRSEKDNVIDQYLNNSLSPNEERYLLASLMEKPEKISSDEKKDWLSRLTEVSLSSDAYFPFRDNIDRAERTGVTYLVQPGGSVRDDDVIRACNEYGMSMAFSGIRLFHH